MTASQIFDIIAPQYSSDASKDEFIALARTRTNTAFYGANAEQAVAYRAAHMITLAKAAESGESTGNQTASKREGDLAVSYHKSGNGKDDDDLDLTSYGKQLKGLTKGSGPFIGVTGGLDDGS